MTTARGLVALHCRTCAGGPGRDEIIGQVRPGAFRVVRPDEPSDACYRCTRGHVTALRIVRPWDQASIAKEQPAA